MSMSLFKWLAENNYGGFLVEGKRLERAESLAGKVGGRRRMTGGARTCSVHVSVNGYQVEWSAALNQSRNTTRVTPACTCADWLQSGGWTEKRLCKHQMALALATDIPATLQPMKPEAHVAREQSGNGATPEPGASAAKASRPPFHQQIANAIDQAIGGIATQVREILDQGYVPLLVGPTGSGKTSAVRRVAQSLDCRLVEHAGADSYTDSDLVGVMMPSGLRLPGPVAQALGHAREMREPVLLFLDEFTRYHMRAQESLMRLLLPIGADVAKTLGVEHDGAIRATSAPFWGDEWAPADLLHTALACNPWGTPLDPALVRRTVPVMVGFADEAAALFDANLAAAIRISWTGTQDGTLPLPLEYGELARAAAPGDIQILDRYRSRLAVLDPAAATAFDALLKGAGVA